MMKTRVLDEVTAPRCSRQDVPAAIDDLLRRSRVFGQVPGRNKLKAGSRLLVSSFPEIKLILSCCGVL